MKKIFISRIFLVLVTAIIVGGITVFAEAQFQASEVGYKGTTVDKVLDICMIEFQAKKQLVY